MSNSICSPCADSLADSFPSLSARPSYMLLLMLMLAMIAVSQEEGFLGKDLNRVIWPSAVVVGCVGSFEKAALWQCVSYFSNAS